MKAQLGMTRADKKRLRQVLAADTCACGQPKEEFTWVCPSCYVKTKSSKEALELKRDCQVLCQAAERYLAYCEALRASAP